MTLYKFTIVANTSLQKRSLKKKLPVRTFSFKPPHHRMHSPTVEHTKKIPLSELQ